MKEQSLGVSANPSRASLDSLGGKLTGTSKVGSRGGPKVQPAGVKEIILLPSTQPARQCVQAARKRRGARHARLASAQGAARGLTTYRGTWRPAQPGA